MLGGMLFLVLCIGVTVFYMSDFADMQGGLHVRDVSFEEMVRAGSGKVVQIKGTIANSGAERETVPRVALILRQANGMELTRKFYRSTTKIIDPGGQTRFVTSFLYDTPFLASVEAMLE